MFAEKRHNVAFAWTSIIAIAVFVVSWIGAMALNPTWVVWEDAFSDLGASYADSRFFFNFGCCILTGVIFAVFGAACIMYTENRDTAFTGLFLVFTAVALFFVGVFPTDVSVMHNVAAMSLGFLGFITACLYAVRCWNRKYAYASGMTVMFLLISVFTGLVFGFAALELVCVVATATLTVFAAKEMMFLKPARGA